MGAKVMRTQILNLLESRFDYQSARNVLSNWRKGKGIKDDIAEWNAADVHDLAAYLESSAENSGELADKIRRLTNGAEPVALEAAPEEVDSGEEAEEESSPDAKTEKKDGKRKKKR